MVITKELRVWFLDPRQDSADLPIMLGALDRGTSEMEAGFDNSAYEKAEASTNQPQRTASGFRAYPTTSLPSWECHTGFEMLELRYP
jgi:hypothetical protein